MHLCSVPGCTRERKTKGLCSAHYQKSWRGEDLSKPLKFRPLKGAPRRTCSEANCSRIVHAHNKCKKHYYGVQRHKQGYYRKNDQRKYFENKLGISLEFRDALIDEADHKCQICLTPLSYENIPNVDHCHSTGMIRGVLCGHCNRGLGLFKDSAQLLAEAIKYLSKEPMAPDLLPKKEAV